MPSLVPIIYANAAKTDLRKIADFYFQMLDDSKAKQSLSKIGQEIAREANNTVMEGQLVRVKGSVKTYRWLIYNKKYYVYYRRFKNGKVRILRVYGASRRPLRPDEIGN